MREPSSTRRKRSGQSLLVQGSSSHLASTPKWFAGAPAVPSQSSLALQLRLRLRLRLILVCLYPCRPPTPMHLYSIPSTLVTPVEWTSPSCQGESGCMEVHTATCPLRTAQVAPLSSSSLPRPLVASRLSRRSQLPTPPLAFAGCRREASRWRTSQTSSPCRLCLRWGAAGWCPPTRYKKRITHALRHLPVPP